MRRSATAMIIAVACNLAMAHEPGRDRASVELGTGEVSIEYGTPGLNGRNLDEMIRPGAAWRMGMNDVTTLETTVELDFGGKKLAPGKYTLFARSDAEKNWTLLISTGTSRRLDSSIVALETPMSFSEADALQELLKITLVKQEHGASMAVAWGYYRLQGSFEAS